MAHMDVFNQRPFHMVELSAAIQRAPYTPRFLGNLNLFTPKRVRTPTVSIEGKGGVLSLIQTSERGAPLEEADREGRDIRDFRTVRIARGKTIYATELEGIRAFGTESELQSVQNEVAEVMDGSIGLRAAVELTHENMRLGAVQGIVADANGAVIKNWFTEFGIAQPDELDFDLDNASPVAGAVRTQCNAVTRAMKRAAAGAWIDGSTYPVGLCGDAFWDNLTAHPEVRSTYLNQEGASELRNNVGRAFSSFMYGDILFINYRGTDDNSTVAVNTNSCKFFPAGAPGAFVSAFAPAEFLPFVGQPGQDVYAMVVTDKDRQAWARPEIYSYPLFICTRPGMLQRAKRT
ncbi:major capsid protein [Polaromonas hydrogenivorans]|uniref:Major capsid protein n=1 Tax=Polaromonas hydrogenivorans TaxID=335476 RepID=A0AAU7LWG7_9BURK